MPDYTMPDYIIDETTLETVDIVPAWSWYCRRCQRVQYAETEGKACGPPGIVRCRLCGLLTATIFPDITTQGN